MYYVYFDGASRGNPGHASAGFVICNSDGIEIYSGGEYLGKRTNNFAEYAACFLAIEKCVESGYSNIIVFGDSKLVIEQLNGKWKVRNRILKKFHANITKLFSKFESIQFKHVRRNLNKRADEMANSFL